MARLLLPFLALFLGHCVAAEEASSNDALADNVASPEVCQGSTCTYEKKYVQKYNADAYNLVQKYVGAEKKIKQKAIIHDNQGKTLNFRIHSATGDSGWLVVPIGTTQDVVQEHHPGKTLAYFGCYRDVCLWHQRDAKGSAGAPSGAGMWVVQYETRDQMDVELLKAEAASGIAVLDSHELTAIFHGDVNSELNYATDAEGQDDGIISIEVPENPVPIVHMDQIVVNDAVLSLGNNSAICNQASTPELQHACATQEGHFASLMEKSSKKNELKNNATHRKKANDKTKQKKGIVSSLRSQKRDHFVCQPALMNQITASNSEAVIKTLSDFNTRNTGSADSSNGVMQALAWAETRLQGYGYTVTREDVDYWRASSSLKQLVAEKQGRHADQIIVVGAHLDDRDSSSWSGSRRAPGADDDGSGSSAILEIARVMATKFGSFERTIRFALFTAEEQGTYGAKTLAKKWADRGDNIVAMLNVDMIGYKPESSPMKVAFTADGQSDATLRALAKAVTQMCTNLDVGDTQVCCFDNANFGRNGFASATFFETETGHVTYPEYHKVSDTLSAISTAKVAEITKAVLATASLFMFTEGCTDTSNGATDLYDDHCVWYKDFPGSCGAYDDDDFDSEAMCCGCGGGKQTEAAYDKCSCQKEWSWGAYHSSCASTQHGCEHSSCDGDAPWCLVSNPGCMQEQSSGWAYCRPPSCTDTDNGNYDDYMDACDSYAGSPWWCGLYDTDSFQSNSMCCACGGGLNR